MKKNFVGFSILASLLAPGIALAAFNDVQLTSGQAVFTVGSVEVDLSSNATIVSVQNDGTSLTIAIDSGSTIELKAPNGNRLQESVSSGTLSTDLNVCSNGTSQLQLAASSAATIVVTPSSSDLCSPATVNNVSGASGGGGGGGGIATPASTPASQTKSTSRTSVADLQAKIQALLAQVAVAKSGSGAAFSRDLRLGKSGADVKALQIWLNAHGYVIAAKGPGSPGNETMLFGKGTKAALQKFQKAVGIGPSNGLLGPKTRAYIAAHP